MIPVPSGLRCCFEPSDRSCTICPVLRSRSVLPSLNWTTRPLLFLLSDATVFPIFFSLRRVSLKSSLGVGLLGLPGDNIAVWME